MNDPSAAYVKLSIVKTGERMIEPTDGQPFVPQNLFEVTGGAAEPLIVCRANHTVAVRGLDGEMHDVHPHVATWVRKSVTLYGHAMGIVQGP